MTIFQAVISGVAQGVTEFFPISSSGHLVLLHNILGVKENMLTFDIFLHFGTLVSIVIFFRKDIVRMLTTDKSMLKFIIIGSIPTFIIGILFKDVLESLFMAPAMVGLSLICTGFFLLLASFLALRRKSSGNFKKLDMVNSVIVGISQGIAVIPGISRSGATIGTALISGLDEDTALRFSFLLALPAVLGANLLKMKQICGSLVSIDALPFLAGGIAAMITGILAIKLLFGILRKNLLYVFGVYCICAGLLTVVISK